MGASFPSTVKTDIQPGSFRAEGHAATIGDIYQKAGLYTLLGSLGLAVVAAVMLAIAAWVAVYAPPERVLAGSLIVVPALAMALGLAGFAAFRIHAGGLEVSSGPPEVSRARESASLSDRAGDS